MRHTVCNVVELVRPYRAVLFGFRQLFGQTTGIAHIVVGVFIRRGRNLDQFRTCKAQHVFLFLRLRFRNDDHGFKAHRCANQRKADARVASCAFYDCATGFKQAFFDSILDDVQSCAVFDRLAGVHELGLAQNGTSCHLAGFAQLDKRRISHGSGQITRDMHD